MLPVWARVRREDELATWWNAQPALGIALAWLDVPLYRVAPRCTGWHSARVDLLRTAALPAPAVLVIGVDAVDGAVTVYGLVPLAAPPAPLLGAALVHRRWLYEHELAGAPAESVPPLAHITLEYTWWRRRHTLSSVVFDPVAERPLIARAIDTMHEWARGRVPVDTWALDEATQLDAAKMRFYVRTTLLLAPATLEVHRAALRIGADALGAWTAAVVRRHITSEKRALALIAAEQLPLQAEPLPTAPPAQTCGCGGVALPVHVDAARALAAAYAACGDERAARLTNTACACALLASGRWTLLTEPTVAAYAYAPTLPTSFFVVRERDAAPLRLATLVAALYAHGWAPPAEGVTKSCVGLPDGRQLWTVAELVWPSGRALGEFVAAAGIGSAWDYAAAGVLESAFVPHPHVGWSAALPRAGRRGLGTKAVGTVQTAFRLQPGPIGERFVWTALPEWIGGRVAADARRSHGNVLLSKPVQAAIMREMGTALLARLHALAAYACARPASGDADEVFHGRDYCRLEEWVCARRDRLTAFFRELVAPVPVRADGATKLRAGGHLSFTVEGQFFLCWKDFKLSRGGGHGRGLGSLIVHYLEGTTPGAALQWLDAWAGARAAHELETNDVEPAAPAAPTAADADVPADALVAARALVARHMGKMTHATADTVAWRYLRETRGLADAPAALLEENAAICARNRLTLKTGADDGTVHTSVCAALGFVSAAQTAIQLIYLDPVSARKITHDLAKKTHGKLGMGGGRFDAVPIRAAPAHRVARVFLAEGPETALSVALAFPGEPVYAALGVTFMRGFGGVDADEVVICRENDADAKHHIAAEIRRARAVLGTRFARVREVWPPAGYGDFNDVHQRSPGAAGSAVIRAAIENAL